MVGGSRVDEFSLLASAVDGPLCVERREPVLGDAFSEIFVYQFSILVFLVLSGLVLS